MDISSVGGSVLSQEVQSAYAVKCMLMSRQTEMAASSVLMDTAEISQEAMEKYLAENGN